MPSSIQSSIPPGHPGHPGFSGSPHLLYAAGAAGAGQTTGNSGSFWNWKLFLVVGLIAAALVVGAFLVSFAMQKSSTNLSKPPPPPESSLQAPPVRIQALRAQENGLQRKEEHEAGQSGGDITEETGEGGEGGEGGLADEIMDRVLEEDAAYAREQQAPIYALRPPNQPQMHAQQTPYLYQHPSHPAQREMQREMQREQREMQQTQARSPEDDESGLTPEHIERYRKQHLAHFRLQGLSDEEAEQYISERLAQLRAQSSRLPPMPSGPRRISQHTQQTSAAARAPSQARQGFNDTIRIDAAPTSDGDLGDGQILPERVGRGASNSPTQDAPEDDFRRYRRAAVDDEDEDSRGANARRGGGGGRSFAEDAAAEFERKRAAQDEEFARIQGGRGHGNGNRPGQGQEGQGGQGGQGQRQPSRTERSSSAGNGGDANFTLL
jgi:hypothetical protein